MSINRHFHWHNRTAISALLVVLLLTPSFVVAAEEDVTFELRPFCTSEQNNDDTILGPIPDVEGYVTLGKDKCPSYIVEDPETLRTVPLQVGDELDMEIIIRNPGSQAITHARAWLSYDPNILEGTSISVDTNFPIVTPGEADFDPESGYVMIEASNDSESPNTKSNVLLARVRFRLKSFSPSGTPVSFYDVQKGGHSAITSSKNGTDQYILSDLPGSLHVVFAEEIVTEDDTEEEATSETDDSVQTREKVLEEFGSLFEEIEEDNQEPEEIVEEPITDQVEEVQDTNEIDQPASPQRTAFGLIQVRNVRLTTEGTSLYIGWDALNHPDLKAYNIYYGTTSGRYIQRKTVHKDMKSLIIRTLPFGTKYFVAVRAVSALDEESAFSKEASVEIGNALTSSSPLVVGGLDGGPGGINPIGSNLGYSGSVPGTVGVPSAMALLVLLSAIIGTGIAFRRQTNVYKLK